jgi:phage-related protein
MVAYYSNLHIWRMKNNDGNARRYYLFHILIRIHSIYIINKYIPLMNKVNSMVMTEKLKRTLVGELKRTLAQ